MPLPEVFSKPLERKFSLCSTQYQKYPEALTLQAKRLIILIGGVG